MNADGTGRQTLTSDPGWDGGPTWSPDGRAIAYASGTGIDVVNADGSDRRTLAPNRGVLHLPVARWGHDRLRERARRRHGSTSSTPTGAGSGADAQRGAR